MKVLIMTIFTCMGITLTSSGIEGTWIYESPNAPAGYEKGEIQITKTDTDDLKLSVFIGSYEMKAEKVKIDGNSITCQIWVDGASIPLSLIFDGDSFTGKADTPEGYVTITGMRKTE